MQVNTIPTYYNLYNRRPNKSVAFKSNSIADCFVKTSSKTISEFEIKNLISGMLSNIKTTNTYKSGLDKKLENVILSNKKEYYVLKNPNLSENNSNAYFKGWKHLTEEQKIKLITDIANRNNCKYVDFWKTHPDILYAYVNANSFAPSQVKYFNDETWDLVVQSLMQTVCSKDRDSIINAVNKYKHDFYSQAINTMLRIKDILSDINNSKQNKTLTKEYVIKQKEKLSSILLSDGAKFGEDKQEESKILFSIVNAVEDINLSPEELLQNLKKSLNPIKKFWKVYSLENVVSDIKKGFLKSGKKDKLIPLWRDDSEKIFAQTFHNGISISTLLGRAKYRPELRKEILNYFNTEHPIIKQAGFLSTAIKPYEFMKKNIKWELTLDEGVERAYISDLCSLWSHSDGEMTEAEVLIEPCYIRVKNACYNKDTLVLKGAVLKEPQKT